MRNLYEVLGVAKDADQAAIRKSFKQLARQYHPDLNKDPKASDRFKEINAAYEVLGDEQKRALYDEFGEVSLRPGFDANAARQYKARGGFPGFGGGGGPDMGGFGGGGFSFEDLFGDLFRGGGGGRRAGRGGPEKGPDLEASLRVDLLSAVRGGAETISVRRPAHCGACGGEGGTGRQTCTSCGGMGRVRVGGGGMQGIFMACDACGGTGHSFANECGTCGGTGRTMGEEHLKVKIPPGVSDGQVIRLRGKGGEGQRGGPPGDLLLSVELAPHPFLERKGDDLYMDVPLTVHEALAGARVEVPTPDGPVRVNVPKGATTGQKLRLRGKGVPGTGGRGDLYLVLRPTVPESVPEEALKLAEQLDAFYGDVRAGLKL